jgi:ankyrin repeat protein
VAPGCLHADRRDPETKHRTKTCYRTYRRRGWCVLEIFASYLSRDKTYPALLITSATGIPEFISSMDIQKLAVGTCDFTCCLRNHIFGDKIVACDRGITRSILEKLIESKVQYLFEIKDTKLARLFRCIRQWWLRGSSVECGGTLTLNDLKSDLRWSDEKDGRDQSWIDRDGFSILLYAIFKNDLSVVKEILTIFRSNLVRLLSWRCPREGIIEIGAPGHITCLYSAMFMSSPEIVIALLDAGANPKVTDINGSDAFMAACVSGQLENTKAWLNKFPTWNVNRRHPKFGSSALNLAAYFGPRKFELIKFLIEEANASLRCISNSGSNLLQSASDNDDADPKVIRYLLSRDNMYDINKRRRSQTIKWRIIRGIARVTIQNNRARSALLQKIAKDGGTTPLHYAAKRGDVEIVEILMEHGANAFVKNDLGQNVLSFCQAFPQIKGAIERVKRQKERTHHDKKNSYKSSAKSKVKSSPQNPSSSTFSLQRRLSTATPIKYDMYLLSVSKMLNLFGNEENRKKNMHLCHQDFLREGDLIRFEDLPMGTFIIFVSHQWNGFEHPDPNGVQLRVLCSTLRNLRDGVYDKVEMDPFHVLLYKENTTTNSYEWRTLMENAYVWYDFWCQPQPIQETDKRVAEKLQIDLKLALDSVAAYVERADTMMILAPSCIHADAIDERTGRKAYVLVMNSLSLFLYILHLPKISLKLNSN